jgi:hypothetical protein
MLLRKLLNFLALPGFVQSWVIPLWLFLGISKALIFSISFKRLAPYLGHSVGTKPWTPMVNAVQEVRARQIGQAVRLAARYTPWDSNCFPQAVAARLLLGLYGIPYAFYFGLMRDPDSPDIKAHAWVTAGKVRVTGGRSFGQFTVVGVFCHLPSTQQIRLEQ